MQATHNSKVILVTGSSSGVGLATSILLAKSSHIVYASMRDLASGAEFVEKTAEAEGVSMKRDSENSSPGRLHILQLDVTSQTSVTAAIERIVEQEGRLDVLINNAGYSLAGAVDDVPLDAAKALFETNLWGVVRTVKETLPLFRKQGGGQIINVSSVGGLMGFPFQEYYCASKFAVEGFTESLALSNAKLNVKVSIVEPGAIKTAFVKNAVIHAEFADEGVKSLWDRFMENMMATMADSGAQSAEDVGQVIKAVVEAEKPRLRYQTSVHAQHLASAVRKDPTGESIDVDRFFSEDK